MAASQGERGATSSIQREWNGRETAMRWKLTFWPRIAQQGQHGAGPGVVLERARLAGDGGERLFRRDAAGHRRGGEVAHADAQHAVRHDAVVDEGLRQRVFDHVDGRMGDQDLVEPVMLLARAVVDLGDDIRAADVARHAAQRREVMVEPRLALKQLASHLIIMAALACEHEDEFPRWVAAPLADALHGSGT